MNELTLTRPRGQKTGRPAKIKDDDLNRLVMMWNMGMTLEQLAKEFNCHRATVNRALKEVEARQNN